MAISGADVELGSPSLYVSVSVLGYAEHLTEGRVRLEAVLRLAGDEHPRERARSRIFRSHHHNSGDYLQPRII